MPLILLMGALALGLTSCHKDSATEPSANDPEIPEELGEWIPPTPLVIDPGQDVTPVIGEWDNPLTVEGVALGEALFYDPILSFDSTLACASCHHPEDAFSDRGFQVSIGVDGKAGTRNAPALFNLNWGALVFWDGRSPSLEEQALHPVRDEKEMALPWLDAVRRLNQNATYRIAFWKAFGNVPIDSLFTARALAQYVRSLVSFDSRFDRWKRGEVELTDEEMLGYDLFRTEKTDCSHCHQMPIFTRYSFHNIGLDSIIEGTGMGAANGLGSAMGLWKVPSLRNLAFTAPYMHDGRFTTLDEVIDHYESGGHYSQTLDRLIRNPVTADERMEEYKALSLSEEERKALLAFFNTLNDSSFVARHSQSR